jgi:transcriptional regulator with XRE-family HTH domain
MMNLLTFGMLVSHRRKKMGKSQTVFSRQLNISRTYLSQIENDKADNMSARLFIKLVHSLDIPLDYACDLYTGIAVNTTTTTKGK